MNAIHFLANQWPLLSVASSALAASRQSSDVQKTSQNSTQTVSFANISIEAEKLKKYLNITQIVLSTLALSIKLSSFAPIIFVGCVHLFHLSNTPPYIDNLEKIWVLLVNSYLGFSQGPSALEKLLILGCNLYIACSLTGAFLRNELNLKK